ncbi:hypothetical protein D3C80_1425150 [compost metagenome]
MGFWQLKIPNEHISAFTAFARDGHSLLSSLISTVSQNRFILRLIESWTRVVRHPAVNCKVFANARDILACTNGIKCSTCIANHTAARLDPYFRQRVISVVEIRYNCTGYCSYILLDRQRAVPLDIADAEASSEVDNCKGIAKILTHFNSKICNLVYSHPEAFNLKNLRADMRMHTQQV